jgi:hypothetical protein
MKVTIASDPSALPEPGGELSTYSRLGKSLLKINSIWFRPIRGPEHENWTKAGKVESSGQS